MHVAGKFELAGEPIGRVVIAQDYKGVDARLAQAPHPVHEIKGYLKVAHVAVEDVAGEHHEAAFLLDCKRNQVVERLARRRLYALSEFRRLARKPDQRAVQVQIGGM